MKTLSQLRTDVMKIVKDTDKVLESSDVDFAVLRAIRLLSQKSPLIKTEDKTGDGSTFKWAVPSAFSVDFSTLVAVYYPFDETDEEQALLLEPDEYDILKTSAGAYYFRLNSAKPSSSEKVRFVYTAMHSVTDASSTLTSTLDEDAIIFYAASQCLVTLAIKSINTGDPSLGADTVVYGNRYRAYMDIAIIYLDKSGLKGYEKNDIAGGCVFVSLGKEDPTAEIRFPYNG
jgi:hypothetical protein